MFQKRNVLDSGSSSSDYSSDEQIDKMELFTHKNTKISSLFQKRLLDTVASYEGKDLNMIDKKLLRGLHQKKLPDDDE